MEGILLALFVGFALLVILLFVVLFGKLWLMWIQCLMSGAPVSLPQLVAMRLRRTPIETICRQRIKAHAACVELTTAQLESVSLQGADVEKIVDALLLARRTDRTVSWEQLVAAELEK